MKRKWLGLAMAALIATAATVLAAAPAAHAESTVGLLCRPTGWTGGGWQTYAYGGYCQNEIVYHVTPTGGPNGATATWTFSNLSLNGNYRVDAWIPWYYANAKMDWDTTVSYCAGWICRASIISNAGFDEGPVNSWQPIAYFTNSASGVQVQVKAWSGMVTPWYYMGVDAIQLVRTG
jgi:hypothetical protein